MGEPRDYLAEVTTHEPAHEWFGLSYASYLVLPRSAIQSMPVEWQRRLVACLNEIDDALGHHMPQDLVTSYDVRLRGERGRYRRDPLVTYERGHVCRSLRPASGGAGWQLS